MTDTYSAYSNIANATTALPAPSAFTATVATYSSIDLAWTDNSTGEDGFEVYRSTDNVTFSLIHTTAANAVSWTDTGLTQSTLYYYKLRSKKGTVYSTYATDDATTSAYPAPSAFSVTASAFDTCDLAWTDNSSDEDGFEVYRSSPTNGSYSLLATTAANAVTYSDDTCEAETTYYYKIRAKKGAIFSAYATEDSDTTPSALSEDTTGASFALKFDEYWDNFTGIRMNPSTTSQGGFYKYSNTVCDVDATESFVLDIVAMVRAAANTNTGTFFDHYDNADPGIWVYTDHQTYVEIYIKDDGGHGVVSTHTVALNDGLLHLHRVVFTRGVSVKYYLDNVLIGTTLNTSVTDKISGGGASRTYVGCGTAAGNGALQGNIYEAAFGKGVGVTTLGSHGPGSGVTPYDYISDSTTGLVCHWKMNEASGDITDSKNSVVLADTGAPLYSQAGAGQAAALYDEVAGLKLSPVGVATYNVAVGGGFAALTPGVTYATGKYHHADTVSVTDADIGTSDFTLSLYAKLTAAETGTFLDFTDTATGNTGYAVSYDTSGANNTITLKLNGTSYTWTMTTTLDDSAYHAWVISADRSGNATITMDGTGEGGNKDISGQSAADVTAESLHIAVNSAHANPMTGTFAFWKLALSL